MRKTYRGDAIEVTFDLDRCIHVGECLLSQPDVFDLRRRPWIDPNADDPDAVAATVERCPSGALQYRRLDGGAGEAHASTSVVAMRNGPLLVTGEVHVRLEDGTEEVLPRATLCRCGGSARKPFCDNTHLKNRLPGAGRAVQDPPQPRPAASRGSDDRRRRSQGSHLSSGIGDVASASRPKLFKPQIEEPLPVRPEGLFRVRIGW